MSELATPIAIASVLAINLLLLAVWQARWRWALKCQSVCNSTIRKAAAACAVTALVLVAWFYATLPDPIVRTSLRANVERFQFQVVAPVNASQRVSGMRLRTIGEEKGRCVDGVIQPQAGTFVEFVRTARGQTGIRVEFRDERDDDGKTTVAVLLAANKEPERIVGGIDLSPDTGHCLGRPPDRFAIDGVAEFGHEFRAADLGRDPAAGYLSDGWVSMFITGIDRILFWPLSPRLIQVESVLLPAGSRVQAAPPKAVGKNEDSRARWIGVATADMQQRGFVVDASTNARVIEIRLSGAERERSELRVSDFTRATQDGNILWFYTSVVAIWGAAVAVLSDVAKKWLATRLGLEPKEMPSSTTGVRPSLRKPVRSRPRGTLKLLLLTFALAGMTFDSSAAPVRLTTASSSAKVGCLLTTLVFAAS